MIAKLFVSVVSGKNAQVLVTAILVFFTAAIHVSQLLKPRAPVLQVVVVLGRVRGARIKRAERSSVGALALVIEDENGIERRRCGIVVCLLLGL